MYTGNTTGNTQSYCLTLTLTPCWKQT